MIYIYIFDDFANTFYGKLFDVYPNKVISKQPLDEDLLYLGMVCMVSWKIKRKVGKDKKDAAGLRRKKNRFARLRKNLIQGQ